MPKLKLHVAPVLLGGGVRLFDGSVPTRRVRSSELA